MSLVEMVPSVRDLPRADKLRLMQLLVVDLAEEEGVPLLTANGEYPIWSPLDAFEAAETLTKMLDKHKARA